MDLNGPFLIHHCHLVQRSLSTLLKELWVPGTDMNIITRTCIYNLPVINQYALKDTNWDKINENNDVYISAVRFLTTFLKCVWNLCLYVADFVHTYIIRHLLFPVSSKIR